MTLDSHHSLRQLCNIGCVNSAYIHISFVKSPGSMVKFNISCNPSLHHPTLLRVLVPTMGPSYRLVQAIQGSGQEPRKPLSALGDESRDKVYKTLVTFVILSHFMDGSS